MKTLLEKIYDGEFAPSEHARAYLPQRKAHREHHFDHCEAFCKTLDDKQKADFLSLWDELYEDLPYASCEGFITGFKAGVQLMNEVLGS